MNSGPAGQRTRLRQLERRLGDSLFPWLRRSWRDGSLTILALLLGYYVAQNFSSLLLLKVQGGRPVVVLALLLLLEVPVRLRTRLVSGPSPLGWVLIDNLRLGVTYALVLEAFKLGT